MSKLRKIIAIMLLTVFSLMGLNVASINAGTTDYSIKVTNDESTTGMSIKGKTFNAYKIFDVTYDSGKTAYSYTITSNFSDLVFTTKNSGIKTGQEIATYLNGLTDSSTKTSEAKSLAHQAYKHAVTKNLTPEGVAKAAGESVDITHSNNGIGTPLTAGYYVVANVDPNSGTNDEVFGGVGLTTTNPTGTIANKGDGHPFKKEMVKPSTAPNVGDEVTFKISGEVPDLTGYTKYDYIVTDTVTEGLDLPSPLAVTSVTIGGAALSSGALATGYTLEAVSTSGFKLSMDLIQLAKVSSLTDKVVKGKPIEITYKAKINNKAFDGNDIGAINTANLTYSNNPADSSSTGKTTDKKVPVYTFGFDITKQSSDASPKALNGAKFVLRDAENDGKYYNQRTGNWDANGTSLSDDHYFVTAGSDGNKGKISIKGLGIKPDDGEKTYYLEEIEAPAGYNKLTEPIALKVTPTVNSSDPKIIDSISFQVDTGNVTTANLNGESDTNFEIPVTVKNTTGTILPGTGGIGTTLFYVIGGGLMILAFALLIRRKIYNNK